MIPPNPSIQPWASPNLSPQPIGVLVIVVPATAALAIAALAIVEPATGAPGIVARAAGALGIVAPETEAAETTGIPGNVACYSALSNALQ